MFDRFSNILKNQEENRKLYSLHKKEVAGTITEEEFKELARLEITQEKRKLPPSENIFSPKQDLSLIRKTTGQSNQEIREAKESRLSKFKQDLARSEKVLSRFRTLIEEHIEDNPDIPLKNLQNFIEIFCTEYKLSGQRKQEAMNLVHLFYEARKRAKEFRQKFPNDFDLVKEITGLNLDEAEKDSFRVSVGLMNIDIYTNPKNTMLIYDGSKNPQGHSVVYDGFATQSWFVPPVYYNVYNTEAGSKKYISNVVVKHEEEHQKNKILSQVFEEKFEEARANWLFNDLYKVRKGAGDLTEAATALRAYFELMLKKGLHQAKDEILAMKKDGDEYDFKNTFQEKKTYDYLREFKENPDMKQDETYQELAKEVLVEKYNAIVSTAVAAFDKMVKESDMTKTEVIAFFTDRKLEVWEKAVNRYLAQRSVR